MKKVIVLLIFVSGIATAGYSQFIKKGTILGGGAFEFRSQKDGDMDNKRRSLSLSPWAGYMVIDNLAVGALLSVSSSSLKLDVSDFKQSNSDILFGPVVRYYMDNGLFAHGQFGFGPGRSKVESGGTTTTTKFNVSELRLGAGYAVRISDTVLFEPIAGYLSRSSKVQSTELKNSESGFFLMAGFTIFFSSTN